MNVMRMSRVLWQVGTCALVLIASTTAQTTAEPSSVHSKAAEEYEQLLARVQKGDLSIDLNAFRRDGAIVAGSKIGFVETGDRNTFKQSMEVSNFQLALDSSNRLLAVDYASEVGHYDAMMASRALQKTDEAVQHEKIMNALLDSVAASGDGKTAETAYFAATTQEEYIFMALRLKVKAKKQGLVAKNGHFWDCLDVVDLTTGQPQTVWFNADVQINPDGNLRANAAASANDSAPPTEIARMTSVPPVAPTTLRYTPPEDGLWSKLMHIEVIRTDGSDRDHFVVHFRIPDPAERFVSPNPEISQFSFVNVYGSRIQGGARIDTPKGLLPTQTGNWKPGDPVTLDFDLPREFANVAEGGNLRFCVGGRSGCLPSPNLLVDGATTPPSQMPVSWIDTFQGKSRGISHGISYGSLPNSGEAVFTRTSESRIEYRTLPREGTLEWWVMVRAGYHYDNYALHEDDPCATLFSSEVNGGDVTWPGAARLILCNNGDIKLDMAHEQGDGPHQILTAQQTAFRFGEWHSIGISFGSMGQAISVDGATPSRDPDHQQRLGAAGTHEGAVDVPTIGETVSSSWPPQRYSGGFEGIVARFRVSANQQDWSLTRAAPPVELTEALQEESAVPATMQQSTPTSLYDQDGIAVSSVETARDMQFTVRSPDPVYVSLEVDRDQNGQIDRLVDVAYRPQRDGSLCTQFLIDDSRSTVCGGFVSAAYLKTQKEDHGRREYALIVPKKELSFNGTSVRLSIVMWNSAQRHTSFYPPERFKHAINVQYMIPPVDASGQSTGIHTSVIAPSDSTSTSPATSISVARAPNPDRGSLITANNEAAAIKDRTTYIRLKNDTAIECRDVTVNDVHFGDIRAGAVSGYQPSTRSHRFASIALLTDSDPFSQRPIDFLGERILGAGDFTYVLTSEGGRLQLSIASPDKDTDGR